MKRLFAVALVAGLSAAWLGCIEGERAENPKPGSGAATAENPTVPDGFTLVTLDVPNMT